MSLTDLSVSLLPTPEPVLCGCPSEMGTGITLETGSWGRRVISEHRDDISDNYLMPLAHREALDQTLLAAPQHPQL